jgi:3-hydroxyisobutyrate dehydrogenase
MSDQISFIGVGNMGNPMAKNLMNAGKKVKVFDISKNMIEKAKKNNLEVVENLDDLITKETNIVITMLPEGKNSKDIYLGEKGIINKVSKNCLIIDCSTIDIQTSIEIGKKATSLGIKMIDAPVSGGVMGAKKATLNIMVGGTKESFELALPILKIMGKNIFHAGEIGCGNGAKICNNMSLGITMIAASESLMLAKRLNIDIKKVHEIMKNASGNSWPISVYPPVPGLIEGTPSNNKYKAGFSSAMMAKDLKLANEASKSVNANTPLGKKALEIFSKFCESGNSEADFSAISKLIGDEIWDYPFDPKSE